MLAYVIIAALVGLTLGSAYKRLLDLPSVPLLFWVVALISGATPLYVGWRVLEPGLPVDSGTVMALHDKVTLELPAGHSIMVTANLSEESDDPAANKTAYNLKIVGDGWRDSVTGTIKRKQAGSGPDIDVYEGEGISESGRRRSGALGEDLQDRFDFSQSGLVEVEVSNWAGTAAQNLALEVVRGPPSRTQVWLVIGLVTILGLVTEIKYGADKLTPDVAFLAFYGLFLRDGVTPLDDFQGVAWAAAPAFLFGYLIVAGGAYVAVKYGLSSDGGEAESVGAETPEQDRLVSKPGDTQSGDPQPGDPQPGDSASEDPESAVSESAPDDTPEDTKQSETSTTRRSRTRRR